MKKSYGFDVHPSLLDDSDDEVPFEPEIVPEKSPKEGWGSELFKPTVESTGVSSYADFLTVKSQKDSYKREDVKESLKVEIPRVALSKPSDIFRAKRDSMEPAIGSKVAQRGRIGGIERLNRLSTVRPEEKAIESLASSQAASSLAARPKLERLKSSGLKRETVGISSSNEMRIPRVGSEKNNILSNSRRKLGKRPMRQERPTFDRIERISIPKLDSRTSSKEVAGIFSGYSFVLDLGPSNFDEEREIKRLVETNGGKLSYQLKKNGGKLQLLVSTPEIVRENRSTSVAKAIDECVDIVSVDFLKTSLKQNKIQSKSPYVLLPPPSLSELKNPDEDQKGQKKRQTAHKSSILVSPSKKMKMEYPKEVPFTKYPDSTRKYPEDTYEIVNSNIFVKLGGKEYVCIELHIAFERKEKKCRVFHQQGEVPEAEEYLESVKRSSGKIRAGISKCQYALDIDHAIVLYAEHYKHYKIGKEWSEVEVYSASIGSRRLQSQNSNAISLPHHLQEAVARLTEDVFDHANHRLYDLIGGEVSGNGIDTWVGTLSHEQIKKGFELLLTIKIGIEKGRSEEVERLSEEFNAHVPSRFGEVEVLDTMEKIAEKFDLLVLMEDLLDTSEGVSEESTLDKKYRSLRCSISACEKGGDEYERISKLLQQKDGTVLVDNIFSVQKEDEARAFGRSRVGNKGLLLHGTEPSNVLGILAKGMQLPHVVVSSLRGERSDEGNFGNGIYFTDSMDYVVRHGRQLRSDKRYVFVSEVAEGREYETTSGMIGVDSPPLGYDSILGKITENEYVIFRANQQRLRYLVEFSTSGETTTTSEPSEAELESMKELRKLNDPILEKMSKKGERFGRSGDLRRMERLVEGESSTVSTDERSKSTAKLISSTGEELPLNEVIVKTKIVDIISSTTIHQRFRNNTKKTLEAKYLFPLDAKSVVSGFEAFIGDKRVVGVVKAKEEARKEYKEAVSRGDGAYMMEQVEADVFSLSLGNVPPETTVIIKIVLSSELRIDNGEIEYVFPSNAIPIRAELGKRSNDSELMKSKIFTGSSSLFIDVAVEMPYEIIDIHSNFLKGSGASGGLLVEKSETKASLKLKNEEHPSLGEDLCVYFKISKIHYPRMVVEEPKNPGDLYAAMLVFFPEFEASAPAEEDEDREETEWIFALDRSQSMESCFSHAKSLLFAAVEELAKRDSRDSKFNIAGFGSYYRLLFPNSVDLSKKQLKVARKALEEMKPDFGGTDLWLLLKNMRLMSSKARKTNLIVVSDCYFSQTSTTFDHAEMLGSTSTRLFVINVGEFSSSHYAKLVSRAGNGLANHIRPSQKDPIKKLRALLDDAASPSVGNVSVTWQCEKVVHQSPSVISSVFSGQMVVVYGFLGYCLQANLVAKGANNAELVNHVVSTNEVAVLRESNAIHSLCAHAIVDDYDTGIFYEECDDIKAMTFKRQRKEEITQLGVTYGVLTPYTSFIAIEVREKGEKLLSVPQLVGEDLLMSEAFALYDKDGEDEEWMYEEEEGEEWMYEEEEDTGPSIVHRKCFGDAADKITERVSPRMKPSIVHRKCFGGPDKSAVPAGVLDDIAKLRKEDGKSKPSMQDRWIDGVLDEVFALPFEFGLEEKIKLVSEGKVQVFCDKVYEELLKRGIDLTEDLIELIVKIALLEFVALGLSQDLTNQVKIKRRAYTLRRDLGSAVKREALDIALEMVTYLYQIAESIPGFDI